MKWFSPLVAFILLISPVFVLASEFQYTIKGASMDSFHPYYTLYSDGKVLIVGIYSKGVENYLTLLKVTPNGKALGGGRFSLSFGSGESIDVNPIGLHPVLLKAPTGYYLIIEAHSKKIQSFDGILILKLDDDLNVRWGELISAYVNRTYGGKIKLTRTHIYPRDAVLAGKYLYILAKLGKWAVVMKVSVDENNPLYGKVLWAKGVTVTFGLEPKDILVYGDRIYVVATNAESAIGGARIILIEMLTNGTILNILGYSHYRSQEGGHLLYASGIAKSEDGFYIIGTYESGINGTPAKFPAVIKIASNGTPVWGRIINEPGLVTNRFIVSGDSLYLGEVGSWIAGAKRFRDNIVLIEVSGSGEVKGALAYSPNTLRSISLVRGIWTEGDIVIGALGMTGSRSFILFATGGDDPCWRKVELNERELKLKFHPVDPRYFEISNVTFQVLPGVNAEKTIVELKTVQLCTTRQTQTQSSTVRPTHSSTSSPSSTSTLSYTTSHATPSSKVSPTSTRKGGETGGICGPAFLVVVASLPLLFRRGR